MDELHDLAGVIHLHSMHSDGTGTVAEIARAGQANGLDYVLLTDHDTLAAQEHGEEGWHGECSCSWARRCLRIARTTTSRSGSSEPIHHRGLSPQQIVERVNEAGGFGFLAHPFSKGSERFRRGGRGMPWRDLECTGYTGLELWSFVTDSAERVNSIRELLRFIAVPGRFIDHPPARNLARWDEICRQRTLRRDRRRRRAQVGIRVRGRVPLRLMAYKRSFRFLRTHLLARRAVRRELEHDRDARLRRAARRSRLHRGGLARAGAAGSASGRRAERRWRWATRRRRAAGRSTCARRGRAKLRLLQDGAEIAAAPAHTLEHEVEEPGVYRVEAYLHAHGRERTWILSNPIYCAERARRSASTARASASRRTRVPPARRWSRRRPRS